MRIAIKILVVIVLVIVIVMTVKNNQRPKGLGIIDGKLAEVPETPNGVSTQTSDLEKKVEAMPFKETLEESKIRIKDAIMAYGGGDIIREEDDYLYVVFKTGTMKFKDDAEFYFDSSEKLIHFRSASRVGHSDMGLNRERYEAIKVHYLK